MKGTICMNEKGRHYERIIHAKEGTTTEFTHEEVCKREGLCMCTSGEHYEGRAHALGSNCERDCIMHERVCGH